MDTGELFDFLPVRWTDRRLRTYLIFGSFCFSMFFFVWFFVPETKGISLEAMDKLFGITDVSDKSVGEDTEAVDRKGEHSVQEKRVEVA